MELIDELVKTLNVQRDQAEGGVGAVLKVAENRLSGDDFSQVLGAVPGLGDLLGKAPQFDPNATGGIMGLLAKLFGGIGGLRALLEAFKSLGLSKSMIMKFVGIVLNFVRKQGGPQVEELLRKVLK